MLTTDNRRPGFTLIEILVAIGVATILFGICTAIFVKASQFKSRSEKLLFMAEEANGALGRMARDIQGLYAGGGVLPDYWQLEPGVMGPSGSWGDRLTLLAATENPGRADYCTVQYYVSNGNLHRVLSGGSPPAGGWSASASVWVIAEGVDQLTITCVPETPDAGHVPNYVILTLRMSDPERAPTHKTFAITVRPGSEEN